ncbi:MAG: chalcone isomerase family protein [Myxococcales bacterium]|nr:chalcone isomerase family protein [Myxococcales bacterium]
MTPSSPIRRRLLSRRTSVRARLVLLSVALVLGPAPLRAGEIEDIPFPESVSVADQSIPLFGLGLLRYRVLFRGYVGGLYLPADATADQTLSDIPKALELYYFWDIEGRFFGEAADELLARSLPAERVSALRERLDRLHALYRDVKAGDRYRLTYEPGRGTTLAYNGQPLGTIPGADFARDYFGIWLGDEPLSDAFRDQLLSGR